MRMLTAEECAALLEPLGYFYPAGSVKLVPAEECVRLGRAVWVQAPGHPTGYMDLSPTADGLKALRIAELIEALSS